MIKQIKNKNVFQTNFEKKSIVALLLNVKYCNVR